MGLDVSINLIVGVPLLHLGEIEEEIEHRKLVTPFGEPTNQQAEIRRLYLSTSKHRYFIGDNVHNILSQYTSNKEKIDYDFEEEMLPNDEYEEWLHWGDYAVRDGIIIGKAIKPTIKYPEGYARLQQFLGTNPEQIQVAMPIVATFLSERFGYMGQLFVIAQVNYSY